jgi:hypothetical protein
MRTRPSLAIVAALAVVFCFAAPARADETAHQADREAIGQVVQQFQSAIIAHDGKALGAMFLQDHDSWLSVFAEPGYSEVKTRHPDAKKIVKSSWKEFAEFVQRRDKPIEERFYNVKIDTNGTVASVWFDFDFLVDGKVVNRGSETWQLVHAQDGWKISSMLYSNGR